METMQSTTYPNVACFTLHCLCGASLAHASFTSPSDYSSNSSSESSSEASGSGITMRFRCVICHACQSYGGRGVSGMRLSEEDPQTEPWCG